MDGTRENAILLGQCIRWAAKSGKHEAVEPAIGELIVAVWVEMCAATLSRMDQVGFMAAFRESANEGLRGALGHIEDQEAFAATVTEYYEAALADPIRGTEKAGGCRRFEALRDCPIDEAYFFRTGDVFEEYGDVPGLFYRRGHSADGIGIDFMQKTNWFKSLEPMPLEHTQWYQVGGYALAMESREIERTMKDLQNRHKQLDDSLKETKRAIGLDFPIQIV